MSQMTQLFECKFDPARAGRELAVAMTQMELLDGVERVGAWGRLHGVTVVYVTLRSYDRTGPGLVVRIACRTGEVTPLAAWAGWRTIDAHAGRGTLAQLVAIAQTVEA